MFMNIILWNKAICLFPRSTMEHRLSHALGTTLPQTAPYVWQASYHAPFQRKPLLEVAVSNEIKSGVRRVGDGVSWTVLFNNDGLS